MFWNLAVIVAFLITVYGTMRSLKASNKPAVWFGVITILGLGTAVVNIISMWASGVTIVP